MKSSTKSSIRNIIAILILGGTSVFFGRLFWNELNFNVENQTGVLVGEVVDIRGQAQRRYENQSRWGSLKGNEPIYNLDAIRTESDSGAVIILKTVNDVGTEAFDEIALGPDTYIVLDLNGRNRNIRFVGGNISATTAADLTVSANNTLVSVNNGAVNLSREEGRQTSVSVNRGEARIQSTDGETTLGTNAVLHVDEQNGQTRMEELAINPLFPGPNANLLSYETERRVDFGWELFEDWGATAVQVSQTPDFTGPDVRIFRSSEENRATGQLNDGTWYWRVIGSQNDEKGTVNLFTINTEKPLSLASPADGSVFLFRNQAAPVNLQWNPAWFAESYRVELSRTSDFANPFLAREVEGNSLLLNNLEEGDWWWRVAAVYRRSQINNPTQPAPRKFTLERRLGYRPTSLLSPLPDVSFSALDVRDGVIFRWNNESPMISYTLTVSDSPDFSNVIATAQGPERTKTLLPAAEAGRYWWRVEANAADGEPVPVSEPRSFTIRAVEGSVELIAPLPGEVIEQEPYTPFEFSWQTGLPGTVRYQLYRVVGNNRTKLIESLVQGNSFTVPLPGEGNYIWKIQVLDNRSRMLIESPEGQFSLRSEFFSPVLRSPSPGSVLNLVGNDTLTLLWDPVPDADAYTVRLTSPNGQIVGQNNRVLRPEQEFSLPEGAQAGEYKVELSSIRDNPPSGASRLSIGSVYSFTVGELLRYNPARLQTPANNSVFGKLESLRNPVTLSWTQNPNLGRFTVELSNGRVTRLYQSTENSLSLEALEEGNYSWKVLSRDSFGREAPESPTFRFSIRPLPSLSAPVIVRPASGEKLDMTGARSLVFEWQTVAGADFYDLALYAQGKSSPIFRETGLTSPRYQMDNLGLLDVGDFRLELKARTEYPDLGVTRESPVAISPFTLSLNISDGAPKILTDELQYAE